MPEITECFTPKTRADWRAWLAKNHASDMIGAVRCHRGTLSGVRIACNALRHFTARLNVGFREE